MKHKNIAILGGAGFVGQHLAARLTADNYSVRILTRDRLQYPQMELIEGLEIHEGDAFDSSTLETFLSGQDAVINLIGILNERKDNGKEFHYIHSDLAHHVVQACENSHVPRLLHMSALNADANNGASHYLRSKGEAEDWALHASEWGLKVTSFRPSVIFGPNDDFFNRFASLLKISPVAFPLACASSRISPVYIGDVCQAFIKALSDDNTIGRSFSLCGPTTYTLKQLVEFTARTVALKRVIIGLPNTLSKLQARILGLWPTKPFTIDNYRSLQVDSVCENNGLEELGIKPASIESIVPMYLGTSSRRGYFDGYRKQTPYSCNK